MEATKTKPSHSEFHDRIASVERRLERRRARLLDDVRESTDAAGQAATKLVPIAAALGAGLLAMYLTRRRTHKPRYLRYDDERYVPESDQRRGVRWASLAGLVGTIIRVATSPQFRAIVQNFRERRARY
jgi:hypothetical protein